MERQTYQQLNPEIDCSEERDEAGFIIIAPLIA